MLPRSAGGGFCRPRRRRPLLNRTPLFGSSVASAALSWRRVVPVWHVAPPATFDSALFENPIPIPTQPCAAGGAAAHSADRSGHSQAAPAWHLPRATRASCKAGPRVLCSRREQLPAAAVRHSQAAEAPCRRDAARRAAVTPGPGSRWVWAHLAAGASRPRGSHMQLRALPKRYTAPRTAGLPRDAATPTKGAARRAGTRAQRSPTAQPLGSLARPDCRPTRHARAAWARPCTHYAAAARRYACASQGGVRASFASARSSAQGSGRYAVMRPDCAIGGGLGMMLCCTNRSRQDKAASLVNKDGSRGRTPD